MKKKIELLVCLALLFSVTGCKSVKLDNGENAIVTFTEGGISAEDLYEEMKATYGAEKVMNLIDAYLLDKLYDETDEEKQYISENLKSVKESAEEMDADLDLYLNYYYGVSDSDAFKEYLRLNYRRDLYATDYAKEQVTDTQIEEYYESEVYGDIEASQILLTVDVSDDATDEEKEEAENAVLEQANEIIEKLNNGEDFATLAKEYSKDEATASNGGSLGSINKDDVGETIFNALLDMEDGTYSTQAVETSDGYYILYRTSQSEKAELDDDLKEEITETIAEELKNESGFELKALEALREKNEMKFEDTDLESDFNDLMERYESQYSSSSN